MQSIQRSRVTALALLVALCATFLPLGISAVLAQATGVSLTALNAPYSENFDTLANTGSSNLVPNGWYFTETGTSNTANGSYTAGTGSSNAGDAYSFGAAGSTDRAFGGLLSGTLAYTVGVQFTNNTGANIVALTVAYTGEQWRLGASGRGADRLDFQYSLDATSLGTGAWVDVNTLDFNSPVTVGTAGALDGNAAANRRALSYTIIGLNIPNGASFWLRWADFNVSSSDDGLAVDDFSLTAHDIAPPDSAPAVTGTNPANGAANVPLNANLTVTFNEAVTVSPASFTLTCSVSGSKAVAVSGGPIEYTLDPDSDFVNGDSCTLAVLAAGVTDQDGTPDNMAADFAATFAAPTVDPCAAAYTPIPQIQGSGGTAAITGSVTTMGVVVGDYEGPSPALRGFFIQDMTGDGNPATSDGIFVFEGSNADTVNLGDVVRVTGNAGENQGQTQVSVGAILKCSTGTVTPTDVTLPIPSADYLEQYEGMLVRLPQTLYVTEHFQLGRFGQVVLSSGGRLPQPTNIVAPGAPAAAQQAANNLNRIILDDASQTQNPDPILFARGGQPLSASNTLRGGDTVQNIVGVLNYTWAGNSASGNAYRVRPIGALGGVADFQPANPRPAGAPALTGRLRVAGMNLLNFFNTFDGFPDTVDNCTLGVGGGATDCRGADTQAEFDRQWPKTVAAILGTNADVIGVNEVENDGYGPDSALQTLVNQLNAAAGPGTYALINVDAATGEVNALGTDAIKVGMIYKPAKVTPMGQTAALNSVEFVNGGDSAPRSRPALAQAFAENSTGSTFVVTVNHLKSKGSECNLPDQGDGQGNCNVVRTNAAIELAEWLASDPTGTGDPDVLIMGDLNSYAKEDPITALINRGYTNLIEVYNGANAYSYVFDGQWGYLDHALGSASVLPQVANVADWHINADEPSVLDYNTDFKTPNLIATLYAPNEFRIADHDPVLVDLNLSVPPTVDAGGPYAANEGKSITLSATGSDPDGTAVSFAWDLNNDNVFETPGQSVTFNAVDGSFSYPVQVQITDASGATSVDQAVVNVSNVAPSVGPISGPAGPVNMTTPVAVSAPFSDPGVLDTHTALWNWGDGTTSAGSVSEANGSGTAGGSHTYARPGVYTITLVVTDKDGGSGQASREQVIYATNGGFVVGAGTFNSPKGTYTANPNWSGHGVLAFLAQYPRRSATVPTGYTTLQLIIQRFTFESRGFDWLVIAGNQAQLQGSGVVNGRGSYGFLLTVSDQGSVDKVRLKIWDKSTGSVVYDTQPGAPNSAAPTTTLQGSSVVFDGSLLGGSDAAAPGAEDAPLGITDRLYLPLQMR
jgi:predicted extracellular nuclease